MSFITTADLGIKGEDIHIWAEVDIPKKMSTNEEMNIILMDMVKSQMELIKAQTKIIKNLQNRIDSLESQNKLKSRKPKFDSSESESSEEEIRKPRKKGYPFKV